MHDQSFLTTTTVAGEKRSILRFFLTWSLVGTTRLAWVRRYTDRDSPDNVYVRCSAAGHRIGVKSISRRRDVLDG
jgi:hypothetical protein